MSLFPSDDKGRKMLPVFSMITRHFPKAVRDIPKVCVANNVRYNPGRDPADINWARDKSPDQLGSAFRHLFERAADNHVFEPVSAEVEKATGITSVYVLAEAAWRVCAALELEIERCEQPLEGVNSAGQQETAYGQADCQDPQRDSRQELRTAGTPLSDRGQESCSQRAQPGVRQWFL